MAMDYRGLYLTNDGFSRAEELYKLAVTENVSLVPKVKDLVATAFRTSDASFDDFYTALYGVKVAGRAKFNVDRSSLVQGERLASLRALLSIDLKKFNNKDSFTASLINEYDVADLRMFAIELRELIPYNTFIETVGLGCIWMEYGIYGNRSKSGKIPFLDKSAIEAPLDQWAAAADRDFGSWGDLKGRFGAQLELAFN
jgi:hypothetical protein